MTVLGVNAAWNVQFIKGIVIFGGFRFWQVCIQKVSGRNIFLGSDSDPKIRAPGTAENGLVAGWEAKISETQRKTSKNNKHKIAMLEYIDKH